MLKVRREEDEIIIYINTADYFRDCDLVDEEDEGVLFDVLDQADLQTIQLAKVGSLLSGLGSRSR